MGIAGKGVDKQQEKIALLAYSEKDSPQTYPTPFYSTCSTFTFSQLALILTESSIKVVRWVIYPYQKLNSFGNHNDHPLLIPQRQLHPRRLLHSALAGEHLRQVQAGPRSLQGSLPSLLNYLLHFLRRSLRQRRPQRSSCTWPLSQIHLLREDAGC